METAEAKKADADDDDEVIFVSKGKGNNRVQERDATPKGIASVEKAAVTETTTAADVDAAAPLTDDVPRLRLRLKITEPESPRAEQGLRVHVSWL